MLNDLDFAGTEGEPWDDPELEDFFGGQRTQWDALTEEEQEEVEDNFLITKGDESPPEDFGDLALPLVNPEGDLDPSNDRLNKNAVDNADARLGQVEGISESERARAQDDLDELQRELFGE